MNKQQLAAKIWESANRLRSKIEASEYKDYILGFIFYKFLSEREWEWLIGQDYAPEDIKEYVNEKDEDTVKSVQQNLGYFIAYKDLFSTWIAKGTDFSIDDVRTALSAFSRLISPSHKKVFDKIFLTLETGLSKLGDTPKAQTKAVLDLIELIDDIPMDGEQGYDVLGYVYEYLIEQFAANAGKKAGEFYTPHEVSTLIAELIAWHLRDKESIKIYDPTSGSGSLLITIGKAVAKYMKDENRIKFYAQEIKENTYNLTRMNLIMRGILPDNIVTRRGDTLEDDWPYFEEDNPVNTYEPLFVDAVVSNPPYSQRWDPEGKGNNPRFAQYGLAPKTKADYAFLLHDLYHLKSDGMMAIVLPHGVLFRGGEEGEIRKNLIEYNNIDTIIGLPANIFYGTGIPTIIMILRKNREYDNVLIVDASKGFVKEGKQNRLRASDIRRIADTVINRRVIPKYSRRISREEIRKNDYNLNIPRYVDSSEKPETWDLYASMFGGIPESELKNLQNYWDVFPSLKSELFISDGQYAHLKKRQWKEILEGNKDVQAFQQKCAEIFSDVPEFMEKLLIQQVETISITTAEEDLTQDLFRRFESLPLLDPYEAYEILHDEFTGTGRTEGDLELIQQEGLQALKQVDPHMVIKNKKEMQDGWQGHILPFDLVQENLMQDDLKKLNDKKARLEAIPGEETEIIESFSEDDKDTLSEALNETNDAFVIKNVKSVLKELKQSATPEEQHMVKALCRVESLDKEMKALKKEIKQGNIDLEMKTKNTIEHLSEDELRNLLIAKWITPVMEGILNLPHTKLDELKKRIRELSEKYEDTCGSIEKEILETEASLCDMINDLTGTEADMAGLRELQKLLRGN